MADLTAKQKHDLKRFLKELTNIRGRHTELVSVYIPEGYDINKINTHLAQEQGTASNIKSKATRDNVIASLEKMIQHLKLFKQTPPHGLAVFSGNVSEREGQQDIQVWSIEPPVPLHTRIYRCDKTFVLDLLEDMLDDKESYGLIVMDRREASIAMLKGKTIIPLKHETSNVPGKTKAGGQSAARYMRLREDAAKDFYKEIGMMVKDQFYENQHLKGIIVGGPGPTKHEFVDGNFIPTELKKKIIAVKDTSYTDTFGLNELLERSEDVLAAEGVSQEKKLMGKFFTLLNTDPGTVSYGKAVVMKHLEMGAVDTLLLSEELDDAEIELFEKKAEEMGTTVELISTETREGVQLREIGKIAALLRYAVES